MTSCSVFVAFVKDSATMSSIPYFENHVKVFCAKPKDEDPINLNFSMTNKCSIALKYTDGKKLSKFKTD